MQHNNSNSIKTITSIPATRNQIKAVFFDIDGTLVSFKTHRIPDSTTASIKRLQEKGIKVFVATGRSIHALAHIRHLDFDGFVTFNGSCCVDKDGKMLFRKTIDPESIRGLLHYTSTHPLNFVLMYENGIAVNEVTPEIVSMQGKLNLPVPPLIDRSNADVSNVMQANIFLGPEEEAEFMRTVMPDCVATRWTPLFADVNPLHISKKVGVELFCQHFGIDVSETMSFGDGGNDIEMLKHTAIGVAMGSAGNNVKAIADYVTDDPEHDGILKALEYFGVLETETE
ncbi:putative phosphatase [compost metagenome]